MLALPVYGSHIVGGEFELIHLSGYNYQFNLIMYFDDVNGSPGALDDTLTVRFYRKSDNFYVTKLLLSLTSRSLVNYTQPSCVNTSLQTDRLFYSAAITLSPDVFNHPEGYYASWQRCCRNYEITNIYSDPAGSGISAGQTFYIEFPAVIKNGVQFVNSSPHLFPPLSDYACLGRPYYVNFAGVDDDGDSIVYSLTTPLNTFQATAIPSPSPGPYPLVQWRPGFDLQHIIDGSPDLRISPDGLLTCTAMIPGLFVFAVKAEEYRNGIKIGETRRDFQMLAVSGCLADHPPKIIGKKLTDGSFTFVDVMSLYFADTVSNSNRCIEVQVSDPDSQDPLHNFSENVSIRAVALNFKGIDVSPILPLVTKAQLTNGSTKNFQICFPKCPFIKAPYQIGVIAADDACALPMTDTLRVTVDQQIRPNTKPYFLPQKNITAQLLEGNTAAYPFAAQDNEGDTLVVAVVPQGFQLNDAGMSVNFTGQNTGNLTGALQWNAFCKNYEFFKQTDFTVNILVGDLPPCNSTNFDTAVFQLKVILPDIEPQLKIYSEDKAVDLTNGSVEANLGHVVFDVIGSDKNTSLVDTLKLSLVSIKGSDGLVGYGFNNVRGLHLVESLFSWDPTSSIFKDASYNNDYVLRFLVVNDHCKTPKKDSAFVNLRIKDIVSTDEYFSP
ncbi:MAG TPA: hypothetical protein DGG95_03260, partial [Cytophagales bacterium]|nr:hypothetical protein [Cytophagales bacterium]